MKFSSLERASRTVLLGAILTGLYAGTFQSATAAPVVAGSSWVEAQGEYSLSVFKQPVQVDAAYHALAAQAQARSAGSGQVPQWEPKAPKTCGFFTCLFSCEVTCCPFSLCQPPAVTVCPRSFPPPPPPEPGPQP